MARNNRMWRKGGMTNSRSENSLLQHQTLFRKGYKLAKTIHKETFSLLEDEEKINENNKYFIHLFSDEEIV